jgi:hypothetical protein
MGKIYAPSLANLYLIDFDEQARTGFHIKPTHYFRFLDDVFFIFPGNKTELLNYQNFLNTLIPGINITLEGHEKQVNFLDATVYKYLDQNMENSITLQTKIFFKPTDTHQLLLKTSHHPKHTTKGVLKSQLIRFKRISSFKTDYDATCKILFSFLKDRGYTVTEMRRQQKHIWYNYTQQNNLNTRTKDIIPIINENNRIGEKLTKTYRTILDQDQFISNKFNIIAAYKNPKNLRQYLVRSGLQTEQHTDTPETDTTLTLNSNTCKPCGNNKCGTCRIISKDSHFRSTYSKKSFELKHCMDCKSRNIIYLITCQKCHIQYVGETGNPLHTRMNAHRYNILNNKPTAIGIHFNSPQHSISHLSVMPIEKLQDHNNVTKRHGREYYWQKELQTQFPKGLNNFPIDKPELFQQLHVNSIADLEIFWALNSAETQQIV